MTALRDNDIPTPLSADFFRHEPAGVRFLSPELGSLSRAVQSRNVVRNGLLVEMLPPLNRASLFSEKQAVTLMLRLPHQDESMTVEGVITRIIRLGKAPDATQLSIIGVRFKNLDIEAVRALEAHEVAVAAASGAKRAARIPVKFPVEPMGIDVMSSLHALDLSMSGMFVAGKAKFQIGKELKLGFKLPFQKKTVRLSGRVVWNGAKQIPGVEGQISGFGFIFDEVPPNTQTALATYYSRSSFDTVGP